MEGKKRSDINQGLYVAIIEKQNQRSGERTEGVVRRILTNSNFHPHGIKVQLDTGEVGRVVEIIEEE